MHPPTARIEGTPVAATGTFAVAGLAIVVAAFIASVIVQKKLAAGAKPAPEAVTDVAPAPPASAETAKVRYPLRALLAVNTMVDVDASSAHMLGLFPTVSGSRSGELLFVVPVSHPWFREVELAWQNKRDGKLTSAIFRRPAQDEHFKNQKEIADCLAKRLGNPEVLETDHLAGEVTYRWAKQPRKALVVLDNNYLSLELGVPQGDPPITFTELVRTLDGCAPEAPR
jgi:hypothetical protein